MSDKNVEAVHAVLDAIMTEYPGQFPDGPDFLREIEKELQYYVEDGQIESWSIHPMASEGFKIILTEGGNQYMVIRDPENGGRE